MGRLILTVIMLLATLAGRAQQADSTLAVMDSLAAVDAKVDALVTSGKAKLLSRPNITTLQGREAVIEIGGEVPVPEQTTSPVRASCTSKSPATSSWEIRTATFTSSGR